MSDLQTGSPNGPRAGDRGTDASGGPTVLRVRGRSVRTTGALAAAVAAVTAIAVPLAAAAEQPTLDELKLVSSGGWYTGAVLGTDSDGDGWTDWYERLEGTDPYDPASYPRRTDVEVVAGSAFVQSAAFPDRLVVTDVALPARPGGIVDLLGLVTSSGGLSAGSGLHAELTGRLTELVGSGMLASMLTQANELHRGGTDFPVKTDGMDMSLIAGEAAGGSVGGWNVGVGTDVGSPYIEANDGVHSQYHAFSLKGVDSYTGEIVNNPDGTSLLYFTFYHNGDATVYGVKKTDKDGKETQWSYDVRTGTTATSPEVAPSSAPGGATQGSSQSSSASSSSSTAADPTATGGATTSADPKATATPTASNTYADPEAAPAAVVPTRAQVEARVAFLSGVRARFGTKPDIDTSTYVPEPGVADPADPGCEKAGCTFFVDVTAPDLSNVNGGDPVPPELQNFPRR